MRIKELMQLGSVNDIYLLFFPYIYIYINLNLYYMDKNYDTTKLRIAIVNKDKCKP